MIQQWLKCLIVIFNFTELKKKKKHLSGQQDRRSNEPSFYDATVDFPSASSADIIIAKIMLL